MKKVPVEETIFRLCRARLVIQKLEFLEAPLIDEALGEINEAILNLCGVPQDNASSGIEKEDLFVRDWLDEEMDKYLVPEATDDDFRAMVCKIKEELRTHA